MPSRFLHGFEVGAVRNMMGVHSMAQCMHTYAFSTCFFEVFGKYDVELHDRSSAAEPGGCAHHRGLPNTASAVRWYHSVCHRSHRQAPATGQRPAAPGRSTFSIIVNYVKRKDLTPPAVCPSSVDGRGSPGHGWPSGLRSTAQRPGLDTASAGLSGVPHEMDRTRRSLAA